MKKTSQFGRTMLETISVLALVGVLGITGIYMYAKGADSVRADSIIKDVLARAAQRKSNAELSGMGSKKKIFSPEYGKKKEESGKIKTEYETSGSAGYTFDVKYSISNAVVVKVSGAKIPTSLCNAIKSKSLTYDSGSTAHIACILDSDTGNKGQDIIKCKTKTSLDILQKDCSEKDNLYFVVKFDSKDIVPMSKQISREDNSYSRQNNCKNSGGNWSGGKCYFCGAHASWVSNKCKCKTSEGWFDFGQGFCERCPADMDC
jgi:hypothetical protein